MGGAYAGASSPLAPFPYLIQTPATVLDSVKSGEGHRETEWKESASRAAMPMMRRLEAPQRRVARLRRGGLGFTAPAAAPAPTQ